jgi:hypothetical protein
MSALATGLIVGGLAAAGGVAQGVGTARAGKKSMLTREELLELRSLEARKRRGELGLSDRQRSGMEQRFLAEQAGAQRELEAGALQQAAARGLTGAVSGRDVFLQEMAEVESARGLRQEQNVLVQEAEQVAAAAEQARIDAMRAQQKEAKALRAQGIAQAVSLGLAGAAQGAQAGLTQAHQLKMAEAAIPKQTDATLFTGYQPQPVGYQFGGLVPIGAQ